MNRTCAVLPLLALAMLLVLGCSASSVHTRHDGPIGASPPGHRVGHGPPPHAPAHGYRHWHEDDGVVLVFDSGRGVYLVVGAPGHYYLDGRFYRRNERRWESSTSVLGGWHRVKSKDLPPALR